MKSYECLRYEGSTEIKTIAEFCKKIDIEYIGRVFHKKNRSNLLDGEIVKFDGFYYAALSRSSKQITDGIIQTSLECLKLEKSFDINNYLPIDDFDIIIHVWNTTVGDKASITSYAYRKDEIKTAQEKFRDFDIDVLVNGTKITKEDFLSITEIV